MIREFAIGPTEASVVAAAAGRNCPDHTYRRQPLRHLRRRSVRKLPWQCDGLSSATTWLQEFLAKFGSVPSLGRHAPGEGGKKRCMFKMECDQYAESKPSVSPRISPRVAMARRHPQLFTLARIEQWREDAYQSGVPVPHWLHLRWGQPSSEPTYKLSAGPSPLPCVG